MSCVKEISNFTFKSIAFDKNRLLFLSCAPLITLLITDAFFFSDLGDRKMSKSSNRSRKVEESESNSELENDEMLNEMSDDVSFSHLAHFYVFLTWY